MNKLLITILILFLLPTVASFEITNTKFTLLSGQEITQIPHDIGPNQLVARFEVEYRGSFRNQINADLSSIHTSPMFSYNDQILTCQQLQDDLVRCSNSGPYRIYTQQQNNILRFTAGFNSDNFTHTFNIKTTDPEIISIQIQDCDDCHIRNNQLYTIKFNFNQEEKFSNGLFFGFNNPQGSPTNDCEGNSCTGQIIGSCSNGPLNLLIDQESKNDAGQHVKGQLIKQLICDNDAPIIDDIESSFEVIETDQNLNLKINVTDQRATKIDFEFKIDSVGYNQNVTCTNKQGQTFVCDLNINLRDQSSNPLMPGTYNLEIIARDNAKNSARSQQQIIILQSDEDTISNWDFRSANMAHPSMNVQTLVVSRDSYAEFSLFSSNPNLKLRDVIVHSAGCVPTNPNVTGMQGDIQSMSLININDNSFTTRFTVRSQGQSMRYDDMDELTFKCPITVYSRTNFAILQQPQELNVTLSIRLTNQKRIDQHLIEQLEEDFEYLLRDAKTVAYMRNLFTGMQFLCGGSTAVHGVYGAAGTAVQSVSTILRGVGAQPAAHAVDKKLSLSRLAVLEGQEWVTKVCKLFTCDGSIISESGVLGAGLVDNDAFRHVGAISGINASDYVANPYSNLFSAINSACLPAVIYFVERGVQRECEYVQCMIEGVAMQGLDPNFCEESRAVAQCVGIGEQVTSLLAPVHLVKQAFATVQSWLSDPLSFMSGVGYYAACGPLFSPGTSGFCTATDSILKTAQSVEILNNMRKALMDPVPNSCERAALVVDAHREYFNNPTLQNYAVLPQNIENQGDVESKSPKTYNLGDDRTLACQQGKCTVFEGDITYDGNQNINFDGKDLIDVRVYRESTSDYNWSTSDVVFLYKLDDDDATQRAVREALEEYRKVMPPLTPEIQEGSERVQSARQRYNDINKEIEEAKRKNDEIQSSIEQKTNFINNIDTEFSVGHWDSEIKEYRDLVSIRGVIEADPSGHAPEARRLQELSTKEILIDGQRVTMDQAVAIREERKQDRIQRTNEELRDLENQRISDEQLEELENQREEAFEQFISEGEELEEKVRDREQEMRDRDQSFFNHMRYLNVGIQGSQSLFRLLGIDGSRFDRGYRSYFFNFGGVGGVFNWMDNWMGQTREFLNTFTQFERNICLDRISNGFNRGLDGERSVLLSEEYPMLRTSGMSFRPGLYMVARKTILENPLTEEIEYSYLVGGTSNPKIDVRYDVYLLRGSTKEYITDQITNNPRMAANTQNLIANRIGNQARIQTDVLYDSVCIEFETRLYDLFDITGNWGTQVTRGLPNVYCRSFEGDR